MKYYVETGTKSGFGLYDYDLPTMAIDAASEIDDIIHEREYQLNNTRTICEMLEKYLTTGNDPAHQYQISPVTTTVLSKAFNIAYSAELNIMSELKHYIGIIVETINNTDFSDKTELEKIRDYFLNLANIVMSHQYVDSVSRRDDLGEFILASC